MEVIPWEKKGCKVIKTRQKSSNKKVYLLKKVNRPNGGGVLE